MVGSFEVVLTKGWLLCALFLIMIVGPLLQYRYAQLSQAPCYSASLRTYSLRSSCLLVATLLLNCPELYSLCSYYCIVSVFAALILRLVSLRSTTLLVHSLRLFTMSIIRCAHSVLSCSLRSHVVSIRCAHVNTPCSLCT
jgi:hypothetical protein